MVVLLRLLMVAPLLFSAAAAAAAAIHVAVAAPLSARRWTPVVESVENSIGDDAAHG